MNRQLRILNGLHQGATVVLAPQERHLIGSDPQCSVVMCDPGVAPRHCVISIDDYGMTCRAIDAPVMIEGQQIQPGETSSLEDFTPLQCGSAIVSVGPSEGDWSAVTLAVQAQAGRPRSPLHSLQRLNPYALFAIVMIGITSVIGVAYAALSGSEAEREASRVEIARRWLKEVAPPDSELTVGVDGVPGRGLLLSGYVVSTRQVSALDRASRSFRKDLRMEVYAVEDMLAAMSRMAQLAGVDCDPLYQSAGRLSCRRSADSESVAAKLRNVARDVPGLRSLEVQVNSPPALAKTGPAAPVAPNESPRLTQKFSVLMFRNQRFLIGPYGERYREGEEFDGFRIDRIEVDKVLFARDGRQFDFHVAALRTASR